MRDEHRPSSRRRLFAALIAAVAFLIPGRDAHTQDGDSRFSLHGFLDFRFGLADSDPSWLDGGFGKLRYGSESSGDLHPMARVAQASAMFSVRLTDSLAARCHLNIDADPGRPFQGNRIDIVEAFVSHLWVPSPRLQLRTRGGLVIPPFSQENTGPAWSTPYTLTSSAINGWFGEETRTAGIESRLVFTTNAAEYSFTGSVFGANDPNGTLLAWRGWSMSDRQTGLKNRLPLPPIAALQPGGLFPRQAPWADPMTEIDGRIGWYISADYRRYQQVELRGYYYDNRGDPKEFDGNQYAWYTEFAGGGVRAFLPLGIEAIGQYLDGTTAMGRRLQVDVRYRSWFLLATREVGRHRFSVRYDSFRVDDRDAYLEQDNNNESGSAWTAAWLVGVGSRYKVGAEYLRVDSDRPARSYAGLDPRAVETLVQIALRVVL